jgi:hypothetical protein
MANTGFKGELVQIGSMTIEGKGSIGTIVRFRVLFADKEGVVHAHMNHEVAADDPAFIEAAKALHAACKAFAEKIHFTSPNTITTAIASGIAESLSDSPDAPDEPGKQG